MTCSLLSAARCLPHLNRVVFPTLYAIVDADAAARCGWTVEDLAAACLRGGARMLQVRAKRAGSRALLSWCDRVVQDARPVGASLIVNDRADVAALSGADGVHVGQDDLRVEDVRRVFPSLRLVGLSTHTPEQLASAVLRPASYVAVGPVFDTGTKATGYHAVGLALVRAARRAVEEADGAEPRAVVAIGGITLERAADVLAAGATSVAVISDLLSTGDPEARVRAYLERFGRAG